MKAVMERLTTRNSEGIAVLKIPYKCDRCGEETWRLVDYGNGEPIERLAHYEELQEQVRLLKLPCAVGDEVWYISERLEKQGRKKIEVSFVDNGTVDNITLGHAMIPQITVCNGENIWITFDEPEDFGKTVFLTQEEAEAALRKMEGAK